MEIGLNSLGGSIKALISVIRLLFFESSLLSSAGTLWMGLPFISIDRSAGFPYDIVILLLLLLRDPELSLLMLLKLSMMVGLAT